MDFKKNPSILLPERSALLIIDIQERILKVIRKNEKLVENVLKLIKGAKILNIPIYFTEQYPQGLGHTLGSIHNEINSSAFQKISFSCRGADNLFMTLKDNSLNQIIVAGVESHVCVQQTVLDLLENSFQVNLVTNAVSSRTKGDYKTSLRRMEKEGAILSTVESVLFELLHKSGTNTFKSISKIIK